MLNDVVKANSSGTTGSRHLDNNSVLKMQLKSSKLVRMKARHPMHIIIQRDMSYSCRNTVALLIKITDCFPFYVSRY